MRGPRFYDSLHIIKNVNFDNNYFILKPYESDFTWLSFSNLTEKFYHNKATTKNRSRMLRVAARALSVSTTRRSVDPVQAIFLNKVFQSSFWHLFFEKFQILFPSCTNFKQSDYENIQEYYRKKIFLDSRVQDPIRNWRCRRRWRCFCPGECWHSGATRPNLRR